MNAGLQKRQSPDPSPRVNPTNLPAFLEGRRGKNTIMRRNALISAHIITPIDLPRLIIIANIYIYNREVPFTSFL